MIELLNKIQDHIHWANIQNSKVVFERFSQPIKYMETISPSLINQIKEMSKEQLITMILNYELMQEDILKCVQDELEKY